MRMMVCNIGWCSEYQGDRVDGNHTFIKRTKGDGSERWNFKPYPDGTRKGYFRGIGKAHALPRLSDNARTDWTILFYARDPADGLLKIIGYYRSATILPDWKDRPERIKVRKRNYYHAYCVVAPTKSARLFPKHDRPLFGRGLGQAGFVYLTDPSTGRVKANRKSLYRNLLSVIRKRFPNPTSSSARPTNPNSPITIDPIRRMAVETASMSFVKRQLRREGYLVKNVSRQRNIGYDLKASKGTDVLYVEVKGTAGSAPRFIISRREMREMETSSSARLAIVTSALSKPKLHVVKGFDVPSAFRLDPLQLEGNPRTNTSKITTNVKRYFVVT